MILKFAIKDFIEDRSYKNLSKNTIKGYELILGMFHDFCVSQEIVNVQDLTGSTVKSFLLHLQEKGNNPTSRNTKLRTLKTFLNYLEEIDVFTVKSNPAKKMNYAKEDINIQPFTDYQIAQMLGYLRRNKSRDHTFCSVRDYTMIVFLLGTGVRLGELISIKWSDVDIVHGSVSVYGKKREISSMPLAEKLCKELAEYRIYCEQHFKKIGMYVFSTDANTQLSVDACKSIFRRLKNVMNFDVRLSCHSFRTTFAVRCIQNGMDVFTLQRLLRHTDLNMTNRYVRLFGTALKSQAEKFNPLNGIDL